MSADAAGARLAALLALVRPFAAQWASLLMPAVQYSSSLGRSCRGTAQSTRPATRGDLASGSGVPGGEPPVSKAAPVAYDVARLFLSGQEASLASALALGRRLRRTIAPAGEVVQRSADAAGARPAALLALVGAARIGQALPLAGWAQDCVSACVQAAGESALGESPRPPLALHLA